MELPIELAYEDARAVEDDLVVRKALGQLPEKYKEVLVMRYFLGYNYQDIAQSLGLPDGTVKSRINRARAQLQKKILPYRERFQ